MIPRHLQEVFDDCLPTEKTIYNWLNKIDGSPGFTSSTFGMLREKVSSVE